MFQDRKWTPRVWDYPETEESFQRRVIELSKEIQDIETQILSRKVPRDATEDVLGDYNLWKAKALSALRWRYSEYGYLWRKRCGFLMDRGPKQDLNSLLTRVRDSLEALLEDFDSCDVEEELTTLDLLEKYLIGVGVLENSSHLFSENEPSSEWQPDLTPEEGSVDVE